MATKKIYFQNACEANKYGNGKNVLRHRLILRDIKSFWPQRKFRNFLLTFSRTPPLLQLSSFTLKLFTQKPKTMEKYEISKKQGINFFVSKPKIFIWGLVMPKGGLFWSSCFLFVQAMAPKLRKMQEAKPNINGIEKV